jgi:hypothetical protein
MPSVAMPSATEAESMHHIAQLLKVDIRTGPRRAATPTMGAAHVVARRPRTPSKEAAARRPSSSDERATRSTLQ